MKKILVAVDNSKASRKAAHRAAELASAVGASVKILTVVSDSAVQMASIPETVDIPADINPEILICKMDESINRRGEELLKEVKKIFAEYDCEVETILEKGEPPEEICRVAEEEEIDLIILADKGEGKIQRFFLGSTSDKVVRYAPTSVMVVK